MLTKWLCRVSDEDEQTKNIDFFKAGRDKAGENWL